MNQSVIVLTAAVALSTIAFASAQAGPYASGMSTTQKQLQSSSNHAPIVHKTGKKHKKIIAGLVFGFSAAAAIGYSIRHERQCRRWERRCWNGRDRACWKFERRC